MRRPVAAQFAPDHPDTTRTTADPVRVVCIPSSHPYVERVTSAPGIELLPDPHRATDPVGQWWPPVALDEQWIYEHAADADLLHIHFGTESFSLDHLRRALAAARDVGWPIVLTVHDIDHPQLGDQSAYFAQLDVLVPAADALITLTTGAAEYIGNRWGRSADVIAHPSVLSFNLFPACVSNVLPTVLPEVPGSIVRHIGVFLKDIRPNVDALGIVQALSVATELLAAAGTEVIGEVYLHHRVRDDSSRQQVRALVAASGRLKLVEHDRLDDQQLAIALGQLDACVLPYRHGTHSGWLELCWDLAVAVAAPAVGYFADQHHDPSIASFTRAERGAEPGAEQGASLAAALAAVLGAPTSTRPGSPERAAECAKRQAHRRITDEAAAVRHAALYRQLVAERRA